MWDYGFGVYACMLEVAIQRLGFMFMQFMAVSSGSSGPPENQLLGNCRNLHYDGSLATL